MEYVTKLEMDILIKIRKYNFKKISTKGQSKNYVHQIQTDFAWMIYNEHLECTRFLQLKNTKLLHLCKETWSLILLLDMG